MERKTLFEVRLPEHEVKLSDADRTSQLLRAILLHLVDDEGALKVEASISDQQDVSFRVMCAPQDQGKLIGRQGRTARSLRTLINAIGTQQRGRYTLDIRDLPPEPQ